MRAIRLLASHSLSEETLFALAAMPELHRYEHTGVGYFATIRHPGIPAQRVVCSKPIVLGESDGIRSGFVVFLENNELTLECHSWGPEEVPETYREQDVQISIQT